MVPYIAWNVDGLHGRLLQNDRNLQWCSPPGCTQHRSEGKAPKCTGCDSSTSQNRLTVFARLRSSVKFWCWFSWLAFGYWYSYYCLTVGVMGKRFSLELFKVDKLSFILTSCFWSIHFFVLNIYYFFAITKLNYYLPIFITIVKLTCYFYNSIFLSNWACICYQSETGTLEPVSRKITYVGFKCFGYFTCWMSLKHFSIVKIWIIIEI